MADHHTLYLLDGSGFIFRAFHALPMLTRADGTPVNAVLGFCNILTKLLKDIQAQNIAVVFDKGRKTFRHDIYPDYKAHRPDPPPELVPQFALVREATRAFGIPAIELENYEADDLIASYAVAATRAGMTVVIVSADKDLMQLVNAHVSLLDPIKQKPLGSEAVIEKFGVPPDKVVDVQALAGDSVDHIPGVPGIGIKTAAELIVQFGDLEHLLANAHTIKQPKRRQLLLDHADMARLSKKLVTLATDVPLPLPLEQLKPDAHTHHLQPFLHINQFKSLLARYGFSGVTQTPSTA
ncbi:MAG: DNA polymerase I, partial [Alphaproteobacteria bacterium]|nr:DNA polymerase I [Alphaproteobacteria bacterium]